MRRTATSIVLGLLFVGSCRSAVTTSGLPTVEPVPVTRIPIQPGEFSGMAWLPGERLVVNYIAHPENAGSPWEVWQLATDGSAFRRVPAPDDPACERTQYLSPTRLPAGDLGVVRECNLNDGEAGVPADYSLWRVDMESGRVSPLVTQRSLGYLSFTAPVFSVSPTADRAVISAGDQTCGTIAWVDEQGLHQAEFAIGNRSVSWPLDQYFQQSQLTCSEQGLAGWPSWSPDDRLVAFLGSVQVIGVEGLARLDVSWNLYLVRVDGSQPRPALRGLRHAGALAWSPDGRWLAFTGEVVGRGGGIWIFDPKTGDLLRVSDIEVNSLDWSPDGTRIAAIRPLGTDMTSDLVIFDLRRLIQ